MDFDTNYTFLVSLTLFYDLFYSASFNRI